MQEKEVAAGLPVPRGSSLRFAVAMRGGVSLAVWIGGALNEIDRLRRGDDGFLTKLLGLTRFDRVEVDILAGASAGGLNAALGCLAVSRGRPLDFREVWGEVAGIDDLLATSDPGPPPRRSILDGRYFLTEIQEQLALLSEPAATDLPQRIEVFLAATVVGGVKVTPLDDPAFSDVRREAYFHYRHLCDSHAFSDIPSVGAGGAPVVPPGDGSPAGGLNGLDLAARATASFPGAFEPVEVPDAPWVTSRLRLPSRQEGPVRLVDGGVVDNIPVARAIRAVAASPARDAIRRWVLFLHPSPTVAGPASSRGSSRASSAGEAASVVDVVKDVVAGLGSETLLDDLEVLEHHNVEAADQQRLRDGACEAALDGFDAEPDAFDPAAVYGPVDAGYLLTLLGDPSAALGWIPIGQQPPEARPLGEDGRSALADQVVARTAADGDTVRPFARLVRLAHLLIEWIRWQEVESGTAQPPIRRRTYDVMEVAALASAYQDSATVPRTGTGPDPFDRLEAALKTLRTSGRLAGLVAALGTAADAEPDTALHLRARLPTEDLREVLDALANVEGLGGTVAAGRPVDARLLDRLGTVARELAAGPPPPDEAPALFTTLRDAFANASAEAIRRRLVVVDTATAPLHRGRAAGIPLAMSYQRISGSAPSPMAANADDLLGKVPRFRRLRVAGGQIDPRVKLSGNKLGNFSAFLSPRFRANDWMWGRMDAAAGLVDVLVRPAHLAVDADDDLAGRLEAAVTHPFPDDMGSIGAAADEVMGRVWAANADAEASFAQAAAGGDPEALAKARALLTLRWQLEVALTEIPEVHAALLLPTDRPGPVEPAPVEATPADARPAEATTAGAAAAEPAPAQQTPASASAPAPDAMDRVQAVLTAYEQAPRQLDDLLGHRATTALGVRAARATANAAVTGPGLAAGALRTVVAAVAMLAAGAALAPGSFLVAFALLANGVLVPRLAMVAGIAVVLGWGGVSLVLWSRTLRGSARSDWRSPAVLGAVAALHVAGLVNRIVGDPPLGSPPRFGARSPVDIPSGSAGAEVVLGTGTVGVAAGIAAFLLWHWAKPFWRTLVPLVTGLLFAVWVPLGAWKPAAGTPWYWEVASWFGSLWLPAVLVTVALTWLALRGRPEDRA